MQSERLTEEFSKVKQGGGGGGRAGRGLTLDAKSLHVICETPLSSPSQHHPQKAVCVHVCVKITPVYVDE